jgi:hypothetical protein
MANKLPSGRWRGRVVDQRTRKQIAPHLIVGGPKTYATRREAERAEDAARDALLGIAERGVTVREFGANGQLRRYGRGRANLRTFTISNAPARSWTATATGRSGRSARGSSPNG